MEHYVRIEKYVSLYAISMLTILLVGCGQQGAQNMDTTNEPSVASTYVCPMRCEGSESHTPGTCELCNMRLVKALELDSLKERGPHTDLSVYDVNYSWINQNNQQIDLKQFVGKYQLVSMIFTSCEYACPNLIGDMLNIDNELDEVQRRKLNFLLVSIDPDRDTPERLAEYANDMDLSLDRWTLLAGSKQATDAIGLRLGVSYKKFENGAFGHSNIISLLNPKGEIIYQLEGIHARRDEVVQLINQL